MKKRVLIASAMLLVAFLAALTISEVRANYPGPDQNCICDHTHEGYADDEYTGTGIVGYYPYPDPFHYYYCGYWDFNRGWYGTGYDPVGNMMCFWKVDGVQYSNYIDAGDWQNMIYIWGSYHIEGLTQSAFPIPGYPEGWYWIVGIRWTGVYAT